jgi:phosphoesterase RecJ-like protein
MRMIDIVEAIHESNSIALITHINPDGDAVGSLIALMLALDKMEKSVYGYCQDDVPKSLCFLDGADRISKLTDPVERYDLAVALDCSDRERMGDCASIMDMAIRSANIDHHRSNTYYADINIVHEDASATGEMIYELVQQLEDTGDKNIAEALYTAIVTDTGGFSFSNTTARTHRVIANLIEWGAEVTELSTRLFRNHSPEWIRLLGEAINTLKIYHEGRVSTLYVTREMLQKVGASEEHINGIIQYGKDISGVELAVFFREVDPSTTKVSFRSGSLIDVSALAQKFGGGGHKRASGCTINLPLFKAHKYTMEVIDNYFRETVK